MFIQKEKDKYEGKDRTFLLCLLFILLLFLFNPFIVCSFLCVLISLSVFFSVEVFTLIASCIQFPQQKLHHQSTLNEEDN
jgi:uncharacterized membrane protein